MTRLSKSKLLASLQCRKRLWLEVHHPEFRDDSKQSNAVELGNTVGAVARKIYDPENQGSTLEFKPSGVDSAVARTKELLSSSHPIFEAGFIADGVLAFADALIPETTNGIAKWRMVEVKSSTSVKDYHRDDIAVQACVAQKAGVPLAGVFLAHIDSTWVYPGNEDYRGLLIETEMTDEALGRTAEVEHWIADARQILDLVAEPEIKTGKHCSTPFECSFTNYCKGKEPQLKHPASWLPRIQSKALKSFVYDAVIPELDDVPDGLLNERQLRVKVHTLAGTTYFDAQGAAADLASHGFPAYFMDFETINFPVPIWAGTRPYQQIPFQFSVHKLADSGTLDHQSFLDISGNNPSLPFAEAIIGACGNNGPIYAYNASFEAARLNDLGNQMPSLQSSLTSIVERLVDLLPVAQERYYHPSQQGSWSIKAVLPTIAPDLSYQHLDGVQDGDMAMNAYLEAIQSTSSIERCNQIQLQLLDYCKLDTYAMVRLWKYFMGHQENSL